MNIKNFFEEFFQDGSFYAHQFFGAHPDMRDVNQHMLHGYVFRLYAPNATNVSIIGDFNGWKTNLHKAEKIHPLGIFECFVLEAMPGQRYKYAFTNAHGVSVQKADPYAQISEKRPGTASIIPHPTTFVWSDDTYLGKRTKHFDEPMSIYEVHLGSWKHDQSGNPLSYAEMEKQLLPYVKQHGFTHLELMPMTQYPFDGSWGYQATGFVSLDSRYGTIDEFKAFINACHREGIGVILDFVVVHFANDAFGLIEFDGTKMYEYWDPQKTYSQWGSPQFDLGKFVGRSLLFSGIHHFLDTFHLDGIRIDAVSNMVYWNGNDQHGENQGGISFLKVLNQFIKKHFPSVMTIAEDSTAFPGVTRPVEEGGLGFDYKWDMGWMNDTLKYYGLDDVNKYYDHHKLSFSMHYFYSERFLLPLSHDEVVHGKGTIINKMFGDYETQFSLLKNFYLYQFAHPGKKLNFMGNELASFDEWDEKKSLPWFFLDYPKHVEFKDYFRSLNELYRQEIALYQGDYDSQHFKWLMVDNAFDSVYIFQRKVRDSLLVFVFNMKKTPYNEYVVRGVEPGMYEEILNSKTRQQPDQDKGNKGILTSDDDRLRFCLEPYAALIFKKRNHS